MSASPPSPKRRWFLKTALAIAAIGGAVGGGVWWRRGFDDGRLTEDGRAVFRALARAIVGPMLPTDQAKRDAVLDGYVASLEKNISLMPSAKRLQLSLLVGTLANAPTRYLASGMWHSWSEATDAQILEALQQMRTSDATAQNILFVACRAITCLTFFSAPDNWTLAGYPGPTPL